MKTTLQAVSILFIGVNAFGPTTHFARGKTVPVGLEKLRAIERITEPSNEMELRRQETLLQWFQAMGVALGVGVSSRWEISMKTATGNNKRVPVIMQKAQAVVSVSGSVFYHLSRAFWVTALYAWIGATEGRDRLLHIYYLLPWWVQNKLAVDATGLREVLFCLTTESTLLQLMEDHAHVRDQEQQSGTVTVSVKDMADYGGMMPIYYFLSSKEEYLLHQEMLYRLAAAMHVFDDYMDRAEDLLESRKKNYFNDFPDHHPFQYWLEEMVTCREYFVSVGLTKIVRNVDGCLSFFALGCHEIWEALYDARDDKNEGPQMVIPAVLLRFRDHFSSFN